jgi:type VI secretion system secreted protein Hcp
MNSDILSENVALNFAQIRVEYQEQSATGGPEGGPKLFGWDLKANAKL